MLRDDGTPCAPTSRASWCIAARWWRMGYWNDAEKTAERFNRPRRGREPGLVLPEIAVCSGDTVRKDEEGFLYFIGRRDEMIKTSGYRVSPTEVEEVALRDRLVGECAALRRPASDAGPGDRRRGRRRATARTSTRSAARRMPRAAAGVHGAGADRRARRAAAAQPQRQDRPQAARDASFQALFEERSDERAANIAAMAHFPVVDDGLVVGGVPLPGSPRALVARRSMPMIAALIDARVERAARPIAAPRSACTTRSRPTRCRRWSPSWRASRWPRRRVRGRAARRARFGA